MAESIIGEVAQAMIEAWLQSRGTILPNGETELHDDYDYGNDDNDFDENSAVYDDEVALNLRVELLTRFIFSPFLYIMEIFLKGCKTVISDI